MARIIAVDDSASMRQMVSFTLKGAGHDVIEASDGVEALKLANQESGVDLVISDINMPNMDGITFVKSVKQMPDYKFTPICMLTTEAEESMIETGKAAGAKAWIIKPFEPPKLLDVVSKLIMF